MNALLVKRPKKELKRTTLKKSTGPRKLVRTNKKILDFVPDEPNPLEGKNLDAKTQDQKLKKQIDAVGLAFRAAAKSSHTQMLHELTGYGAEYCVLVFEDSLQVTAFLREVGYPEPKDVYIDGTVLAQILGVELPPPSVERKRLKTVHNPKLTRLAKPLK